MNIVAIANVNQLSAPVPRHRSSSPAPSLASTSSSFSSLTSEPTNDDRHASHLKHKQAALTFLAAIATINAADTIYSSVKDHQRQRAAVKTGKMTEEEAHKTRKRARLKDCAALGIAVIGVQGAWEGVQEAKEVKEERKEWDEWRDKRRWRRSVRDRRKVETQQRQREEGERTVENRRRDGDKKTAFQGRYDNDMKSKLDLIRNFDGDEKVPTNTREERTKTWVEEERKWNRRRP